MNRTEKQSAVETLNQDLSLAPSFFFRRETRLDDARVVENKQIAGAQQGREFREAEVVNAIGDRQQAAATPVRSRVTCYQLGWELVVKVGDTHGRAW